MCGRVSGIISVTLFERPVWGEVIRAHIWRGGTATEGVLCRKRLPSQVKLSAVSNGSQIRRARAKRERTNNNKRRRLPFTQSAADN